MAFASRQRLAALSVSRLAYPTGCLARSLHTGPLWVVDGQYFGCAPSYTGFFCRRNNFVLGTARRSKIRSSLLIRGLASRNTQSDLDTHYSQSQTQSKNQKSQHSQEENHTQNLEQYPEQNLNQSQLHNIAMSDSTLEKDAPSHSHTHSELVDHSHSHDIITSNGISQDHEDQAVSHSHSHNEGHSHSHDEDHTHSLLHSHSHGPNELLGKGFTTNPAVRITWIGLLVNISMAATKAVGGAYFHSQALMADAIHSVSDMVADLLTLATVNVALKEGTFSKYPLGYGKIESVGTFFVSSVLLMAGFTVGWSSLLQIFEFLLPSHLYDYLLVLQVHSHSHTFGDVAALGHTHSHLPETAESTVVSRQAPNINAAWLALGSIAVKEVLYKKTMKVAASTNSKVLVANAWHHRIDSLTAAVAFVTVTGGYLFGVMWLDAAGGLLVSLLIINAGFGTFKDSWFELIDRGSSKKSETYAKVKLLVEEEVETVGRATNTDFKVADLSVLAAGARTNIVVKLGTNKNVSLETLNKLEFELVSELRSKDRHLGRVFVEYELKKDEEQSSLPL